MPECRFGELAPGARFRWRGRIWTKSGPLLARTGDADDPVMVPRSARVQPLEDPATGPRRRHLLQLPASALDDLYAEVARLVQALPLPPAQLRATLRAIRTRFDALDNFQPPNRGSDP